MGKLTQYRKRQMRLTEEEKRIEKEYRNIKNKERRSEKIKNV